jgi:hypothetical protein
MQDSLAMRPVERRTARVASAPTVGVGLARAQAARSRLMAGAATLEIAALSIAAGLLGVLLLMAGARWSMPSTLGGPAARAGWTARSHGWFTSAGFLPAESDTPKGRAFNWIGRDARLVLPHLDRSQANRLTLQVRAGRPRGAAAPPLLLAAVDGVVVLTRQTSNERQVVSVAIPPRRADGAVVTLAVSNTFVPGAGDRRVLGVVIDDFSLAPATGHFRPSASVLTLAGLAIMACSGGVLLCGFRSRVVALASAGVVAGLGWLLVLDGAFIGAYVDRLAHLGIGIVLAGAAVGLLRWRWPAVGALPEWPTAVGILLAATAVELALFAHPLAVVGDGIFQVHRAMLVHAGTYFFTSVTPKPFFEFPYPVALYVAAQPLWRWFSSPLDQVMLLRGLAVCADAAVGVAIYAAARRQWNDPRTALLCAGLWAFAAAPLQALSNANLTNAFGQAIFGVGMGVIAWNAAGERAGVTASIAAAGLLAVAFLSHFGVVSVGVPILCAVAAMMLAAGRGQVRRFGVRVLGILLVAVAVSYGVYYSHFNPVYRATLARVASYGAGAQPGSKLVATPAVKLRRWFDCTSDDYGPPAFPLLAAAAAGVLLVVMRRRREAFTLVLVAWVLAWAALTALEIFTPIEMRANLAVAPALVCLGAYALGALASRSRPGAVMAGACALVISWDGVRVTLMCLGVLSR